MRILLDTNIVSALARHPQGRIAGWIARVGESLVCTSVIVAGLRVRLKREGRLIGANDLLIAAQALALGHAVVTDNEGEFGRVAGLTVENWLRS